MKSGKLFKILLFILLFTVLCAVSAFGANAAEYKDDLKLRIGLEFGPTSPSVSYFYSEDGFRIVDFNEETYESTPVFETAQPEITVKNIDGIAVVVIPDGTEIYRSQSQTMYLTGINGQLNYKDKTYLEVIKIFCKDGLMRVINIVAFESYLKGVLPREVYPSWPAEALKSAAVAGRTFAIYSLGGKHSKYGVDVCTTTCCQVFGGNGANEYPTTNAAVEETKNQILAYDGKIAMAVYTSSAGYHTESSSGAWGGNQALHPYLCGVPTPHETPELYPGASWSNTYSVNEIFNYINSKASYQGMLKDGISSIDIGFSDSGYANKITVTDYYGNTISAKNSDNVRGMLSKFVKSANFTITANHLEDNTTVSVLTATGLQSVAVPYGASVLRAESNKPVALYPETAPLSYTFTGTGWGHGVGMSQFGAMTLAKNGKTYTEILSLYYPGTYITTLSELASENSQE